MVARPPQLDQPISPRLEGSRDRVTRAIRNVGDSLLFLVDLLSLPMRWLRVETPDALRAANVEGLGRLSVTRFRTVKTFTDDLLKLTTLHLHRP